MPDPTTAEQQLTPQHTTMESQASSISAWSKGAMRNETLMVQEAKQRNEPFVLWPREARPVYISELAEMDVTQLRQLASDLTIERSELGVNLNVEFTELGKCPENMPAARQKIRFTIHQLTKKRSQVTLLRAEALRTIEALIQKPKKPLTIKALNTEKSNSFPELEQAEKKIKHLRAGAFFRILKQRFGDDLITAIETEALEDVIKPFIEWAKSEGVPDDTTNHVIDHTLNAYKSKLCPPQKKKAGSDTSSADSRQCQL
jgi:hypothetical protein